MNKFHKISLSLDESWWLWYTMCPIYYEFIGDIMAVPKHRKSKASIMSRRRANDKRELVNTAVCSECGEAKLPHRVCPSCGMYKGKTIVRKA